MERLKIIGHRGARGLAPENTLTALKKALELKVDMIEFDLRVTADGVAILNHDPFIRQKDRKMPVDENYYLVLKDIKPDLATFKEALNTINKRVPLYVEVKPGVQVEPIIKILKDYQAKGWAAKDLRLASFSQKTLVLLHQALPKNPIIVIEKWSGVRARLRARQLDTMTMCMNQRWLWFGFIKGMSRSGYRLYTYTLNNPQKAERWAKYGLAGVVTDYPDRFKD